jgi:peroxiredoxin
MTLMKLRPLLCLAALLAPLSAPALLAQNAPIAPAAEAPSADAAIKQDIEALVERVKSKLQTGKSAAADFADELKAFDDLSAKYAAEKTDAAAMIGLMKAMLHVQVFDDKTTGVVILKQVLKDFPATQVGARLPEMISEIEKEAAAEAATAVGKEFTPFKETGTDGKEIDLAAYRGKVVLIDFWATWCGPCVDELPHVKAAYEKFHDKGFDIIGISLDKDGDKLAAFTKENSMAWPQFFDGKGWQNKLAQAYGIRSIPATYLLDREGKIVAKGLRGEALSAKIGELLAKKP